MSRSLARLFSRRMAPLAAAAGLVVALAPPLSYGVTAWRRLEAEARVQAEAVAARVRATAERNPLLWRYNTPKIAQAAAIVGGEGPLASVRVLDCDGGPLLESRREAGQPFGPAGRANVRVRDAIAGFVEVRLDRRDELGRLLGISAGASVLGLAVGLLLFLFPTRTVRTQAARLSETVAQLEAAERGLRDANRELEVRVEAAVAEVRRLTARLLQVQDDERKRIARDLHDSVGQRLTALQIDLALAAGHASGEDRARLERAMKSCEETLAEVRRAVRDLRPAELEHNDPIDALLAHAEAFELRTGIATSFRVVRGALATEAIATCLLRVLQESLTNVARHAQAHEVGVVLEIDEATVRLEIADDGRGFDPSSKGNGSGLLGLQERCAILGGRAQVRSTTGEGTTIRIELPNRDGG